jgi:hypothetical protein
MRAPWLHRWQDVVCLAVAGACALLVFLGGGDGGFFTGPYVAAFVFVATWVVIDFLVAWSITRHERREQERRKPRLEPSPPPPPARRAPLPRAVARERERARAD